MLIYANVLKSETNLVGSKIRTNNQQNLKNLRYTLCYKNIVYKNIDDQNF